MANLLPGGYFSNSLTENEFFGFYEQLCGNLPFPVLVLDGTGKIIFVNQTLVDITGLKPENVLGKYFYSILSSVDNDEDEDLKSLPPNGKAHINNEVGSRLSFKITSNPILFGKEDKKGWIVTLANISDTEEYLEGESITNHFLGISSDVGRFISEGLPLHTLMERVIGSIILQLDIEAGYIYLVTPDKTSATIQVHRNLDPVFLSAIKELNLELNFVQKLVDFGSPMPLIQCLEPELKLTELINKFGYQHTVSMALFHDDELVGFLNLVPAKPFTELEMNLFENLGSQLALAIGNALLVKNHREIERKYSTVVERASDGIMISQDGEFSFVNKQLADMLGYSISDMIGMKITQTITVEDMKELLARYEARISGSVPRDLYIGRLKAKSGTTIPVEFNACTIQFEGHPASLSFVRDISNRVSLQKQVVRQKEMAEFYNDILTHDINNFCHNLLGNIDNLIDDSPKNTSKEYLSKLDTCKNSIQMVSNIIDRVQEMMHIQAINPENLTPCNLKDIIKEGVEVAQETFPRKNVKIKTRVSKSPHTLGSNLSVLIFINLLTNAIKHNDKEEKLIEIEVKPAEYDGKEGWEIQISDNGPGISKENLKKIFDRFERFSKIEGKGLGMPIANALVEKMAGKIIVDNGDQASIYPGAKIKVYLPKA